MADNMTTLQILQGIHDWVLDKIDEETANFITKTVNDLVNYYTKSETYTKDEVQQIVDAIKQFTYEVVQVLPTASASTMNKIYLVPAPKSEDKNVKEEYITIQNGSTYSWEMLGTTSIDLSNYYTKGQTDSAISSALSSALASYTTTADLTTLLAQKQDVIQDLAAIRSGASAGATAVQPSTLNSALSDTVAESGVYDVTANNNNAKFASLSALLGSENLDTLIPSAKRKGGMSIKFVQSSDNKYVRYNLLADSFTTDTTQWAIDDAGVYVDNPEFIDVKLDAEGKILWGIKADGNVYFGAGVPKQVVDYIQQKIEELSLNEYEDIVAFLNGLEEGDNTLQQLLNLKADVADVAANYVAKEIDKSLINSEFAASQSVVDNPEYMQVETDSEDKILGGRKIDGTKFENLPVEIQGVRHEVVDNPEWIDVETDSDGKILEGRNKDGVKTINGNLVVNGLLVVNSSIEQHKKDGIAKKIAVPSKIYAIKYKSDGFNLLNRLYIEGLVNNNSDENISINGEPSVFIEEDNPGIVGNKTIQIVANHPEYNPYAFYVSIQRTEPTLLQNKNLRIMHIGDSLTDGGVSCVSSFILKCLNQDYGNINAVFVGTRNDTATIKMGDYEFTCKTSNNGMSGWAISDYLRKVVHVAYYGTAGSYSDSMPGKVAWDSLGLATKTRNGVSERPSKMEFSESVETSYEIRNACHGWYDADPSEELWNWLVNNRGITSFTYEGESYSFSSAYTEADNATQIAAVKYLCTNYYAGNTNPFFDFATVQNSNGEYAFNFSKYLERYKTLADDGITRLVVGETAGTRVTNINSHDLCTPSHVCLVMSHNGGINENDAEVTVNDLILLGDLIRNVDNSIKVIIGSNRPYGFYNPQLYTDSGCYKKYNFSKRLFNINEMLKQKINSSNHLMIDLYAIQNPGGTYKKTAFDLLDGNAKVRDVGDLTHAGELIGYIDRAYQFVGAIISTFVN